MIEFYFCEKFKQNLNKELENSIYGKFSEIKQREDLVSVGNISSFTKSIYILKTSKPNKTRTIIEKRKINISVEKYLDVFFVRDIITNSNFDYTYGKKIFPKLKNGEWISENPLPMDDIQNFIIDYTRKQESKNIVKKAPPSEMTEWFNDFKLKLDNDIYESETWVKYALSSSLLDGMIDKYVNTFRLVLKDIIDNKNNTAKLIKENKGSKIYKYINHNIGILYSRIKINNTKTVYLLLNGAHIEKQSKYWNNSIEQVKNNDIEFENNEESISRNAYRSYPKWTIKKDELWFAIQKSSELSNLSLTKEQIQFFKTFKFPYYINGQAGSGKSTMLYYLFANSYYYKCLNEIKGDIIFLTENETLLENTKNSVYDLLTYNPEFSGLDISQKNKSKKCFNSFKTFLLNMLSQNEKTQFKEDKYLNFAKFKYLYESSKLPSYIINKYSAEESWFTIITYIYGYTLDKKITSQNYTKTVPSKSQIITLDKFKEIEEKVLPFYEKLLHEEGYWDKLKIIRFINNNIYINKKYSVIICDEAQDFCRVELRFILRLSEYLYYDLSNVNQVPIVFAGDPNQTVNPTGFRQSEMTSMLYEELQEIAKFNYNKEENFYNPSFNYRSTQPVVSAANFIQYHRIKNLGIKQLKPQEAKRPQSNLDRDFNIFLNFETINNDIPLQENLINKLKYKIFIIPVNSQEKEEYIRKHKLLSLIDKVEVKTSVEAKGAEYEQVVLFGFGDYFLKNFEKISENQSDKDSLFKRGFFFNKLYVGLTRAQSELLIIDSKDSENLFWKRIINEANIYSQKWDILNNYKNKTIEYNPDSINSIIESTKEDALKNAQKDKEQGLYDQNPARLKVAANQFFRIGKNDDGYECLALSEELKGNWLVAANHYLKPDKNPNYEKAAICLFKGRNFTDLINKIGNNLRTINQDIRLVISRLLKNEKIMKQDINILANNKEILRNTIKDLEWRDEIIIQFISSYKDILLLEQKKDFVKILEFIANSDDNELWKKIGDIQFDLKQYKKAIDAWNEIDYIDDNEKYNLAQIYLAEDNNNYENIVIWSDALLKYKNKEEQKSVYRKIIEIYNEQISENYSKEYYQAVYKSFIIYKKDIREIIIIGKKTEKIFEYNYHDLVEFYWLLLNDDYEISNEIVVFILERWAKNIWKNHKLKDIKLNIDKLNNQYKSLSKKHKIIYRDFNIDELEKISEFPEKIKWELEEQFNKITIHNFRRFKTITLSNLGQYNLIVGDNNVGKTSLLEALLFTYDKEKYIERLAFAHISRKNIPRIIIENEEKYKIPLNFLFDDFLEKNYEKKELIYEIENYRNYWKYIVRPSSKKETEKQFENLSNIDIDEYVTFVNNSGRVDIAELKLILKKLVPKNIMKSPLIPFGKGFDKGLANVYYEKIDKIKHEREEFLESMKIFIPNIERINVNTDDGEIGIEEKYFDVSAPLHQYGEGANKLFRILVQLTLQKGGKLLIDEIDAGIHYSHFSEFWKIILKVARKNNVQVFATTHNLECVKFFSDILKEEELVSFRDKSRIITLRELPNNIIKAYTRNFDEFEYELDNDFEIRGGDL